MTTLYSGIIPENDENLGKKLTRVYADIDTENKKKAELKRKAEFKRKAERKKKPTNTAANANKTSVENNMLTPQ